MQVQEKKVKRISEMNVDPSQTVGNGHNISSSNAASPRVYLPNGVCSEVPYKNLSHNINFPPGGFPTLHLPVVVVLSPS